MAAHRILSNILKQSFLMQHLDLKLLASEQPTEITCSGNTGCKILLGLKIPPVDGLKPFSSILVTWDRPSQKGLLQKVNLSICDHHLSPTCFFLADSVASGSRRKTPALTQPDIQPSKNFDGSSSPCLTSWRSKRPWYMPAGAFLDILLKPTTVVLLGQRFKITQKATNNMMTPL